MKCIDCTYYSKMIGSLLIGSNSKECYECVADKNKIGKNYKKKLGAK